MEDSAPVFSNCYGCGQENPIGLRLKWSYVGVRSHIEHVVLPEHCGYPGLMHGGITCVLIDEAMYHAIARTSPQVVTASLSVDYRSPGLEGHRLVSEAWVERHEGRRIEVSCTIVDADTGRTVAEARAVYLEVDLGRVLGRSPP